MRKIYSLVIVALLLMATNFTFGQATQVSPVSFSTIVDAGPQCSGGQIHDDGVAENGYGWNPSAGDPSAFVTKFIPTVYPYKFTKFCAALTRNGTVPNWTFKIMMWKSVNGMPGLKMDSITVTASAVPVWPTVSFFDFVLPATWANVTGTDSVFIGIVTNPVTMTGLFVAADESPATPLWPAWVTTAAGPWSNPALYWATYRAFLHRAEGQAAVPTPTTPVWVAQTSGVTTSLNCVSTVSDNGGWIGGNGGVILQTTNGGTNWVSKANAIVGVNDVYAICGISASVCLVSTSPAATFVYRTADGGTTWAQVFTQTGGFIDDIRMKDATTGFMYGDPVGGRWSLWKTVNAGLTWDSTGLYLPQVAAEAGWNNAMFMQGNNIWFGTNNTKVYKSNNFGTSGSWTSGVTTGTPNSYSVAFSGLTGFSGTTAAVKSIDAGATYTAVTVPGTGTLYSFNSILNTNRFWYNRANIIYASTDNGANFAVQYTGTVGATFQAMHIILSGTTLRGWSVSNTGLIAMFDQQNVIITNVTLISTTAPETFSLSQNYPNPFNPTTKINFALPKSGLVTLKVYDILGKEVATLVNDVKTAGNYIIDFNASKLSSGTYFYKMTAGDFSSVKRMMLVK